MGSWRWLRRAGGKSSWCRRVCIGLLLLLDAPNYADTAQEYVVKAGLTLNLARYTQWPASAFTDSDSTLNLCLLANPLVEEAFASINGKSVEQRSVQVQSFLRSSNFAACHILYISGLEREKVQVLLKELSHYPLLTIGEDDFFVQHGGVASLQMQNENIGISINLSTAKQNGLVISARVLKLANVLQ